MEAGRITRPLRLFLGLQKQTEAKDRDPQQGGGYQRRGRGRAPTAEELKKAMAVLADSEGFKKSGLQLEEATLNGVVVLLVKDSAGRALRTLTGEDIFQILEAALDSERGSTGRGCILDRRL